MAEKNVISAEKVTEILNDYYPEFEYADWHGEELIVRKTIPYSDEVLLIQRVVDACFDEDGSYFPETREFSTRMCLIIAYTNVSVPEDIEGQHALCYRSDLIDIITEKACKEQIAEIGKAISDAIDVRNNTNRVLFENEVSKAVEAINQMAGLVEKSFEGVSADDLRALITAINDHGIDEEKLAKAVMNGNITNGTVGMDNIK